MKRFSLVAMIVPSIILLISSYGFYLIQLVSVAETTVAQWEKQEQLVIQHERILEATASLARWARYSDAIRGITLTDARGNIIFSDGQQISHKMANSKISIVSPFTIVIQRVIGRNNLSLKISIESTQLELVHSIYTILALFILLLAIVAVSIIRQKEAKNSLDMLQFSFDQLITSEQQLPKHKISDQYLKLWSSIKVQFDLYQEKLSKAAKDSAIAQTTQMLAHDVRKPLSMVKSLLSILESTKEAQKVHKLIKTYSPEVDKAISSVNSMISDIMEVGTNSALIAEPVNPQDIISSALYEVFHYDKKSAINFSYKLEHQSFVLANQLKLARVLSNIISNASQAMKAKGSIWFNTKDISKDEKQFVEFTIGNSGSFIPQEDLSNLFDAFYTKGKSSGTGLGLAIAKKVITLHGGEISCRSSETLGVEFIFTIPAGNKVGQIDKESLPESSHQISEFQASNNNDQIISDSSDQNNVESNLIKLCSEAKPPLKVSVIDDEKIYRNLIIGMIDNEPSLASNISISAFDNGIDAIEHAIKSSPDLILVDVDMGKHTSSGFEIVKILRSKGIRSKICIHSNRNAFETQEEAIKSGADLFLPKPISQTLFYRMLHSTISNRSSSKTANSSAKQKYIIVLDDNAMMLGAWESINHSKKLFFSPESFDQELEKDPSLIENALCIITDQYFYDAGSNTTGLEFAKTLRGNGVTIPIFLCSDGDFKPDELEEVIDLKVSKEAKKAWEQITNKILL